MSTVRFEFTVPGPPFSVNIAKSRSKKHRDWKETVAQAASKQWASEVRTEILPTSQPIEVIITNYFTELPRDVDNVIKPILDSLKGIVYNDDKQVYKVTSQKFDLKVRKSIESSSSLLIAELVHRNELVHIELVWEESEA